uniref:RING-type domain-containing protein n=1 Tax=Parascaris equorum TaxID=6256 RepID=A0A914S532_PAREQ
MQVKAYLFKGDYLGCLLDITSGYVQFYLNGCALQVPHREFMERHAANKDGGFFAAASFMSFQQYPPSSVEFKTFNDYGCLSEEQKTILPSWLIEVIYCVKLDDDCYHKWIEGLFRRRKMELLSQISIPDDSCHICYSSSVDTVLKPCGHSGLCFSCSEQLELCPLCRVHIVERCRIAKRLSLAEQRKPSWSAKRLDTLV